MRVFSILGLICFSFLSLAHGDKDHDNVSRQNIGSDASFSVDKQSEYSKINESYLSEVKPLFKRSCFDCHSNETNFPWYYNIPIVKQIIDSDIKEAKEHLDFSNDFPFVGHETPEKDLKSIKKAIQSAEMPLWSYEVMHSNSKLTSEEKKVIYEWIDNSLQELK